MKTSAVRFMCATLAIGLTSSVWAQPTLPEGAVEAVLEQTRLTTAKSLRVREPGSLYVFGKAISGTNGWFPATCQPLRGEHLKLKEFTANAGGVRGVHAVRVAVVDGRCKGADGWIGTSYITVDQPDS